MCDVCGCWIKSEILCIFKCQIHSREKDGLTPAHLHLVVLKGLEREKAKKECVLGACTSRQPLYLYRLYGANYLVQ
jgi:hypothetical protein